jgi:molybdopterin-guanine dinucleotide biosynthesis protein A
MKLNMTGVLLAGGKSRRMGQDKRFLDLQGRSLLERSLSTMKEMFHEVLIVVAQPLDENIAQGAQVVIDKIPNCGSLGGLLTGLFFSRYPRIFVAACDMPFLNKEVIYFMAQRDPSSDIVVGNLIQGPQPMHGFYSKRCLPFLEERAKARDLKIQNLLKVPSLSVHLVSEEDLSRLDPHLLSFMNVNTPADLEFSRKLLDKKES